MIATEHEAAVTETALTFYKCVPARIVKHLSAPPPYICLPQIIGQSIFTNKNNTLVIRVTPLQMLKKVLIHVMFSSLKKLR